MQRAKVEPTGQTQSPADPWQGHDLPNDTMRAVDHAAAFHASRLLGLSFTRLYPEVGLMIATGLRKSSISTLRISFKS